MADDVPPILDARLLETRALLTSDAVEVLSTDLFDTLLWRKTAEPVDAFVLVGHRLEQAGLLARYLTPEVFAELRSDAEIRARKALKARSDLIEVDLTQIYDQFGDRVWRPGTKREAAIDVELEVERDLLVPDLDVAGLFHAAFERGKRLIAVSDTYFPEDFLRSVLALPPLGSVRFDRLFVSNRYGRGKGEGLFETVVKEMGCPPERILHLGDNEDADVTAPQELGIRTIHFERRGEEFQDALQRERRSIPGHTGRKRPVDPVHGDYGLTALRSKVLHRTEGESLPDGVKPFWRYGAAFLGPVFASYADWIIQRAHEQEATRIFCLMRDGELLVPLVNAAARAAGSDMEAEPLWLSRQVCAKATVFTGSSEELENFLSRRSPPTVRGLVETLGLGVGDLPQFANQAGTRLNDPHLTKALIETLSGEDHLRARIVATSHRARQRVTAQLMRTAERAGGTIVMVDLGWAGTIQRLSQQILDSAGLDTRLVGLYLLTHEAARRSLLAGLEIRGFLGNAGFPDPHVQPLIRVPELLEQVCMPDFGTQIDLTDDLQPVLEEEGPFTLQKVERRATQKGIHAFQREWHRYRAATDGRLGFDESMTAPLLGIIRRCLLEPTPDEARLFGSWLHDENFGESQAETITNPAMARSLRYLDPGGLGELPMTRLYWPYGLAAVTDQVTAATAAAVAAGQWPAEFFRSEVEIGKTELYIDAGGGFSDGAKHTFTPLRNRLGLSLIRCVMQGPGISRLRFDPATRPAIVRIDWIRLRGYLPGQPEPREVVLEGPEALGRLPVLNCSRLLPGLLYSAGTDPEVFIDVQQLLGGPVQELEAEIAFAALPIPTPPAPTHAPGDFIVRGVNVTFATAQFRRRLGQVKRLLLQGRR